MARDGRGNNSLQPADGPVIADSPLHDQIATLERALRCNPNVVAIMACASQLALPSWYLGAGAVAQTVWNELHGFHPTHGIRDYDLLFFDAHDLSAEKEHDIEATVRRDLGEHGDLGNLGATIDVKNEARVHLWYESVFGRAIPPYRSAEHAISTWPTTASSVGVRFEDHRFIVCAPFGMRDLYSMIVRANPTLIDRSVYEAKVARWSKIWPRLTVLPWPGHHEGEEATWPA
jgi:uncharacterized protein